MLCIPLLLVACDRDDQQAVRIYNAPKEPIATQPAPVPANVEQASAPARGTPPNIFWIVPPGWEQLPGDAMRMASMRVDPSVPDVQLTVIPLGPESGEVLPNINRWEKQLGLPPTPAEQLGTVTQLRVIGGERGAVADLRAMPGAEPRMRMIAAMVPHDDRVWFFKLSGPDPVIEKQVKSFNLFLDSIRFAPAATQPSVAQQPDTGELHFDTPAGWTKQPEKQMRVASFFAGEGNATEIIITRLPAGGVGGMSDNINRWRGQIGLPPAAEQEQPQVSAVTLDQNPGQRREFVNPTAGKKLVVVTVSVGDDVWFFKIAGPTGAVEQQSKSFEALLTSVKFPAHGQDSHAETK